LGIVRFLSFESYKISTGIFQSESEKIFKKLNAYDIVRSCVNIV